MNRKQRLSVLGFILTIAATVISIYNSVGVIAKLPVLITIYASGIGSGVSLITLIKGRNNKL